MLFLKIDTSFLHHIPESGIHHSDKPQDLFCFQRIKSIVCQPGIHRFDIRIREFSGILRALHELQKSEDFRSCLELVEVDHLPWKKNDFTLRARFDFPLAVVFDRPVVWP